MPLRGSDAESGGSDRHRSPTSSTTDLSPIATRPGARAARSFRTSLSVCRRPPRTGRRTPFSCARPEVLRRVPVRASDFRASIERDLAANPFTDLGGIAGAGTCRPKHRCDLSKGIEVDDGSRTITIHLDAPIRNSCTGWLFPSVRRAGKTPLRPRPDQPILGTGPYRLASSARGPTVRLVRNPYFRVWSADARPDGYVDELSIHANPNVNASAGRSSRAAPTWSRWPFRGLSAEQPARPVRPRRGPAAPGRSTIYALVVLQHARCALRRRSRSARTELRCRPRQAQRLAGGLDSVTCQVLPSDLPGYRPYCPYTVNPNEAGTWTAPDLAKARSLVAASGTRGTRVAVTTVPRPVPLAIGRYFVSLLRQLGYKASLRVVEQCSTLLRGLPEPGSVRKLRLVRGQAHPVEFPQPDPDVRGVHPEEPGELELAEYCKPEMDAKIRKAALLQTSDPARANALWSEIDRALVDQAVTLPWSAPRTRVLVSARVGNYQNHALWGPLLDQIWVR